MKLVDPESIKIIFILCLVVCNRTCSDFHMHAAPTITISVGCTQLFGGTAAPVTAFGAS